MKTIKQASVFPVYVHYVPEEKEQGKIYISREYGCAVHLCLCGCGGITATPLGEGEWNITENKEGLISMTPSISNYQFECKSHYIITNSIANFV